MANLETLELTIKANAESASGGLQRLVTSLVSLHGEVGKSVSALKALNSELTKLKGFSSMKLPKLTFGGSGKGGSGGGGTSTASAATKAVKAAKEQASKFKAEGEVLKEFKDYVDPKKGLIGQFQSWQYGPRQFTPSSHFHDGVTIEAQERKNQEDNARFNRDLERANAIRAEQAELARAREEAMSASTSVSPARRTSSSVENGIANARGLAELRSEVQNTDHVVQTSTQNVSNAMNETASQTQAATQQMSQSVQTSTQDVSNSMNNTAAQTRAAAQKMDESMQETGHSFKGTVNNIINDISKMSQRMGGFVGQIGRIAKTMLIRGALRALFRAAKQGMDNYYEYSKTVANGYSATVDAIKNTAGIAGNQLGAGLAAMVNAAAPALMTLLGIVVQLAEALTMLFSLLGGKTTYSKAKEGFGQVASSAGGAAAKIKEVLADFDELNVIASESGGGGGGGGGGNFGDMFEEADLPQWMLDWKWAIELAAALALIVPTLIKLIGLFKKLKDLLNIFPKFRPEVNLPSPDYNPFPKQPEYKPFPIQPPYSEFPEEPDYKNALVQMLAISAAIKAAEANMDMLNRKAQLLAITLASIKDKNVKVKLDTSAFEMKRREVDDWSCHVDEKMIRVDLDQYTYLDKRNQIDRWVRERPVKTIRVDVDMSKFNSASNDIKRWLNETATKRININFPTWSDFVNKMNTLNKWVNEKATKYIDIVFRNWNEFKSRANEIDAWVNKHVYKQVTVLINFVIGDLPNLNDFIPEDLAKMKMPTFGGNQGYNPNGKSFYNTSGQGDGGIHGTSATYSYNTGRSANAPMGVMLNSILGDLLPESWLKADGGLISNGDLFIANERGAELVGSFGNSTGVANNDQIIAGIQRGVSDANQEQNALLRQQNELLRGILEKDSSVRLNASASLGRVAQQSLNLYNSMVGG